MLPVLNRSADQNFKPAESKVYLPRDFSQEKSKRENIYESGRNSVKGKIGAAFKLSNTYQQATKNDSLRAKQYTPQSVKIINHISTLKKSPAEIGQEIKMIEKKIRLCQKKIETEKKRKIQQQRKGQENRYEQDFQQIVKREMQLQTSLNNDAKTFDYLTNPGGAPQQQQDPPHPPKAQGIKQRPYSIEEGIEKLQKFYENSLRKKFERRQAFPHISCRRKNPKLYITQKTNALSKHGKPLTEEQHKFRVITKETTPQQIYPVIPNFAVVKDNLSKNIVAYLGDYKPFLDKTKEKVEKQIKKEEQTTLEANHKIITLAN